MTKNTRVSKYNIYFPLSNENKYLIIQGIFGAFDIVESELAMLLKNDNVKEICRLYSSDIQEKLLKRGYITVKSEEEEFSFLRLLCGKLLKKSQKNVSVTFVLTYNCNFRCDYCCERLLQNKGETVLNRQLSTDMVDAVFAQIQIFKAEGKSIEGVFLFGGEPLLPGNVNIFRYICQKANEAKIPIFCISNGYFLKQYVPILNEFKVKGIQVTLDGDEQEHDKRRFLVSKKGTYKTIVDNIDYALKNGVYISLRTNVNKKNINQMKTLISLYETYGWTGLDNFSYYFKATMPCYEELKDVCSDVDLFKEIEQVFGVDNIDKFKLNSVYSSLYRSFSDMLKYKKVAPLQSVYCGAEGGMYVIDPFGDIYACNDTLTEASCVIGNVDVQAQRFIYNDNYSIWRNRSVAEIPHCSKCPYLLFCGGGCAGQARLSTEKGIYYSYCMDFHRIFQRVAVGVCEAFYLSRK